MQPNTWASTAQIPTLGSIFSLQKLYLKMMG